VVDLSNMRLEDDSLRLLAVYLEENPLLRSLAIAENNFADDGILQLIQSLKKNKNLNHLNILGCKAITNQRLRSLEDMITTINMSLYCVEMDSYLFDQEIIKNI
jgi:Ran GTPase-activating protein (RanGAP) involved in mRNA processing and transport